MAKPRGLFATVIATTALALSFTAAAATESVLYNFQGSADGLQPMAGLLLGADGVLYGTANGGGPNADCSADGCGTVFKLTPPAVGQTAWTRTILYEFRGVLDGVMPYGNPLVADASGALYGTTYLGGGGNCSIGSGIQNNGCGTVYKLTPPAGGRTNWTETVLHRFQGGADGQMPNFGRLVLAADGTVYGAASLGGNASCVSGILHGCGIIFALTPPTAAHVRWTERVIHRFTGGDQGYLPTDLVMDADGALYGPALSGSGCPRAGNFCHGLIFKLSPPAAGLTAWKYQALHRFAGGRQGSYPESVSFGANGVLYGTTNDGGTQGCEGYGCGTVFSLTPPAAGKTVWPLQILYRFTNKLPDGANTRGALVIDSSNAIYGTTIDGGLGPLVNHRRDSGTGMVFKLTPPAVGETKWTETVLHNFPAYDGSDGAGPYGGLVMDSGGTLYGTTVGGGTGAANCGGGCGTVYKLAP